MVSTGGFIFAYAEYETPSAAFIFMMAAHVASHTVHSVLIGLFVTPGYALIDTGAQHGVIGQPEYELLCECLAAVGLKPRILPTFNANAVGVGGNTSFILTAEIPIGIKGASGVFTQNVVPTRMPCLLSIGFCKTLGMILDTNKDTATWAKLGNRVSEIVTLPSQHASIDIIQFPPQGSQNPHDKLKDGILRSAFEIGNNPNSAHIMPVVSTETSESTSSQTATLLKSAACSPAPQGHGATYRHSE